MTSGWRHGCARSSPADTHVQGRWKLHVQYAYGCGDYTVSLAQAGNTLTGELSTPYAASPVEGTISGCEVTWSAVLGYESNRTPYRFSGSVADGAMRGVVSLGEFGTARWEARPMKSSPSA